jgi:hypothetical protein
MTLQCSLLAAGFVSRCINLFQPPSTACRRVREYLSNALDTALEKTLQFPVQFIQSRKHPLSHIWIHFVGIPMFSGIISLRFQVDLLNSLLWDVS